jgi:phosphatidate phosphatase PAH1
MQKLLSEVNTTTLSGAMDIVVVEGKDGQLKSTPFYLSVSGTKVWKSRENRRLGEASQNET